MTTLKALVEDTFDKLDQVDSRSPLFWNAIASLQGLFAKLPHDADPPFDIDGYVECNRTIYAMIAIQVEHEIGRQEHDDSGSPGAWEETADYAQLRVERAALLAKLWSDLPEIRAHKLHTTSEVGLN